MTGSATAGARPAGIADVRKAFPALRSPTILLENAGGSQVPAVVADAVRDYMLERYVQLGADYELSRRATATVDAAHRLAGTIMNAGDGGTVVLGSSSTALCNMLGHCYRAALQPGDEVIVADTGHESNIGPWVRLAEAGIVVRHWPVDADAMRCRIEDLEPLLGPRTKLVAFPHVSNLLGEVVDVEAVTRLAHGAGARVVVDGVAFAPHRAIDVAAWGVDWYFFSAYKVYGPHMACLFGRREAWAELHGANHFFLGDAPPYAFEPGGVSHEGCAGLNALEGYLRFLAGAGADVATRAVVERAFETMEAYEAPLIERLVRYLEDREDVRLIGPAADAGPARVGTISFVHRTRTSAEIARAVAARGIGIRHGHMYAYRLCESLGLDPGDGVVRVSFVHYNTIDEIDSLTRVLDEVLA